MLKNLLQILLRAIQKTVPATGDLIVIKSLTELGKFQKLHQRIIQNQMKKKYVEKDLYFQN